MRGGAHRQHPNRAREVRERAWALVEQKLAGRVICARCRATFATFDSECEAGAGEGCAGETVMARAMEGALIDVRAGESKGDL